MFRPTQTARAAQNRAAYIPPHMQQAMAQHVDQSMPAHLKKYQGGDTYIPRGAQKAMAKHLEKSLPPHMKQYAGAYMQQHIVDPSLSRSTATAVPAAAAAQPSPHAPVTYHPSSEFSSVQPGSSVQPTKVDKTGGPNENYSATPSSSLNDLPPDHPYEFIMNPAKPAKTPLMTKLPGNNSSIMRVFVILGGLLVLLIVFSILKGVLSSSPNLTPFIGIIQDQQALIHLTTNAAEQQDLSTDNRNSAATMQASLTSSKSQTIAYLSENHKKVNPKILNLKVSSTIDQQLLDAAAATTYNQTYREVVLAKLDSYMGDLQQTYQQTTGKNGRALLADNYSQAQLLKQQLSSTAN